MRGPMSKVACYPIGRDAAAPIVWDAGLDHRGSAYGASERLSGRHAAGGIRGDCRTGGGRVRAALRKKEVSLPVDWGRGLCLIGTHSGVLSSYLEGGPRVWAYFPSSSSVITLNLLALIGRLMRIL